MDLGARFRQTWTECGAGGDSAAVFAELARRYSESHRHYHTLVHLEHCFAELAQVAPGVQRPSELELALWFHDVIYDPTRSDNEDRSADLARERLSAAGLDGPRCQRVAQLIETTKAHASDLGGDAALLSDIDLAILGAEPGRYSEYEQEVRREYAFVPDPMFWAARKKFAGEFLERPRIFHSAIMFERYEDAARANLRRSIDAAG